MQTSVTQCHPVRCELPVDQREGGIHCLTSSTHACMSRRFGRGFFSLADILYIAMLVDHGQFDSAVELQVHD